MTHPSDFKGTNGGEFTPPEFRIGTPFLFNMNDGLQEAYAKHEHAKAARTLEEAKQLKLRNGWRRLALHLAGFGSYALAIIAGFLLGLAYSN